MQIASEVLDNCCAALAEPYRHPSSGVAVAILSGDHVHVRGFGRIGEARTDPPDSDTLFEIGSITKVFTATLLAALASGGRLALDQPIGDALPEFKGAPGWITPRSLSTHTSGLPRLPIPLWRALFIDTANPYAAFTGQMLIDWIARHRPPRPPAPGRVRYSNLGVGLLGYVLGRADGTSYAEALERHVTRPLGLSDTVISLNEAQRRRFATPHKAGGSPTPLWDFDALAGAGALRSSPGDLAKFARAVIAAARCDGPLHNAIRTTLEVQVGDRSGPGPAQCLGWILLPPSHGAPAMHFHDGGTLGSCSALYVAPEAGAAAVVLANIGLSPRREFRIMRANPMKMLSGISARTPSPSPN